MTAAPVPQGKYLPARRHGSLVFTAGMTPRRDGRLVATGRLSGREPPEAYREMVELACANALAATLGVLADGEGIAAVMSLTVFLATEEDFVAHSRVADFASDHLFRELGPAGIGPRAALGVATLPGGAPIEIQMVSAVRPADRGIGRSDRDPDAGTDALSADRPKA